MEDGYFFCLFLDDHLLECLAKCRASGGPAIVAIGGAEVVSITYALAKWTSAAGLPLPPPGRVGPGHYYEGRDGGPGAVPRETPGARVVLPSGGGVHTVEQSSTPELHDISASSHLSDVDVSDRPVALGRTVPEVGIEGEWRVDFSVSVVQGASTYYS